MQCLFVLAQVLAAVALTSALFLPDEAAPICLDIGKWNIMTDHCDCPAGFQGDASLCCAAEDEVICTDKGDPVATSINKQKFWSDFPCAFTLGTIDDGNGCKVSVLQAGKLIHKGAIYNNHFLMRFETKGLLNLKPTVRLVKIWDNFLQNPLLNAVVDLTSSLLGGLLPLLFDGHQIKCNYNKNTRIWTVNACGSVLSLRGFKGLDAVQKHTPGVCIAGKRELFRDGVCTKDATYTPGPFRSQSERLLCDLIIERSTSQYTDIESPEIRPVCDSLSVEFLKCPQSDHPRVMKECGNILLVGLERTCLTLKLSNPLAVFRDCVSAFCGKSHQACNRLKADIGVKACFKSAARDCDAWINLNVSLP